MRWRDTIFVLVLVCTGCFSSFPPETPESGTRLRARMVRPESGEPTFVGWYDSELEENCSYRRTTDGALRCLPDGAEIYSHGRIFLDASCLRAVVARSPCWDPAFVHVSELWCTPRTTHTLGATVSVAGVFRFDADGVCIPDEGDIREVRLIGDEIPPERFVAAEFVPPEDGPERLVSARLVAEDGSEVRRGFYDRVRGGYCMFPGYDEAPGLTEVPCVDSTPRTFTGGAACDERWVNLGRPCRDEGPPDLTIEIQFDECSHAASYEIVRVGEPVADPTRGATCDREPLSEPHHTSPAPRDAAAWLHQELRGEGRLRARVWSGDDATTPDRSWRAYHDTELDLDCGGVRVSIGEEILCLPGFHQPYPHHRTAYADLDCTVAAVALDGDCGVTHIRTLRDAESGCGQEIDAIHRVGAPLDVVYEERDGACVPMEGVQGHALEPMPFDLFARLEIVVE